VRPGAGGELAGNSEAQKSSEDVSGRAVRREGERFCTLPGEIFRVRAGKKSADAVVAKKRGNARGAKGGRNQTKLEEGLKGSLRRGLKSKGATTTVAARRVQWAEAVEPQRAWRRRSRGGTLRNF
jgi:hypothetical protein